MIAMRVVVWASLIAGIALQPGLGQSFQVDTYSEEDGLKLGRVIDIAQDHDGLMWFSCVGGLLVYDGSEMKALTGDQAPPKKCDYIDVDAHGVIWASGLTAQAPVFKFEKGRWSTLPELNAYKAFGGEPHGFELATFGGETVPILAPSGGGIGYFWRNQWFTVGPEEGLSKGLCLMSAAGDTVYLASNNKLFRLTEKGLDDDLTQLLPENNRAFEAIAAEVSDTGQTRIWLLAREWLAIIENGQFRKVTTTPRMPSVYAGSRIALLPDGRGGAFFGYTLYGYHTRLDDPVVRSVGTSSGLGSDGAVAYFKDREHNIWISGIPGVSKISSMRFANYDKKQGLPGDEVTAFAQWSDREILFAQGSGFSIYDGVSFRRLEVVSGANELARPFFIRKAPDGSFLIPSIGAGIYRITPDEKVALITRTDDEDARQVLDVLPQKDGPMWVGTDNGLRILVGDSLKPMEPRPPRELLVRCFLRRANGAIMMATQDAGVWQYHEGQWYQYPPPNLDSASVTALMEDKKGQLLVGTTGGVYMVVGDQLQPYLVEGELKRVSYFLLEDQKERLWIGTDHGVFVKDGASIRQFTYRHGLIGVETNRGAGFMDKAGYIWIGTDRGASRYQELYDDREPAPPLLKITGVDISGTRHDPLVPLVLPYLENDFLFSFQALSFIDEDTLVYQSWLEGYDPTWLPEYQNASRGYRYTNLPPGKYTFHVRARSADSGWSEVQSSAALEIQPPFWARGWFMVASLLILGAIGYTLVEFFSSKRHSRFLEQQVVERTLDLFKKTEELELQISASREAEYQIHALNAELENRVRERTQQLETAQRDLVENAHYAGMAEIANSIIHNVGNILNSVSTSGYLIRQTVLESKMSTLLKANEMLAEHQHDLTHFLVDDPRGKQLIAFYLSLGEVYKKERERLTKHANLLLEKIDTIKDVVAQQHNYASGIYQNEVMDPSEAVETAIKILENSLALKQVELVRDFEPNLLVSIQKTKFIHTLVNLIKNAKESIIAHETTESRRIALVIQLSGHHVEIRVQDNGTGISPEHLHKIFNHGFTTKKDGHGFGLHSCANAISEMGGTIWAESEGLGHGATFVIHLPLVQRPAAVIA